MMRTVALALSSFLIALAPEPASAQSGPSREYQIKAAFLFHFAQFVSWPPDAFSDERAPFVVGVLGDDPFGETLDRMVAGEKIAQRELKIERYGDPAAIGICQILFVSRSELDRLDSILEALAGRHILTVGEMDGFTDRSGIIRFVVDDDKIQLEINAVAATEAKLTISSKLLRLAQVVQPVGR